MRSLEWITDSRRVIQQESWLTLESEIMWAINSESDIVILENTKQVIAVFVASGLDSEALSWVFKTWSELEERSRDMWHVVVPLIKIPEVKDDPPDLTHGNFNVRLARQLRETYGVDDDDTPVLVFDDFNEEVQQRQVSLKGDEGERKQVITAIESFMIDKVKQNGKDAVFSDLGRRAVVGELVDYMAMQKIKRSAFKLVPKVGSALAKIAITQGAKMVAISHGIHIP
jgi:hypothetical protein